MLILVYIYKIYNCTVIQKVKLCTCLAYLGTMPLQFAFREKLDVHFLSIMEIIDNMINTGIWEC